MLSQALRLRQLLKVGSAGQEILDNGDDLLDKIILEGVNLFLFFCFFFVYIFLEEIYLLNFSFRNFYFNIF